MSTATKTILVTGGNKGIGKAICQSLLEQYPEVHVLLGCRDATRGADAITDIKKAVSSSEGRLQPLTIDTSSDESVQQAAASLKGKSTTLYAIINNAGIGWGHTPADIINTNYFGPRRVNDAFGSLLQRPGGRIVNISSASGPYFLQDDCSDDAIKSMLTKPWTIPNGIAGLDDLATKFKNEEIVVENPTAKGYGVSKALLNAYTSIHAHEEKPDLIINSVTPGFIDTDLTKDFGATNPPSKGAAPAVWLAMSNDIVNVPPGRYYGSDCKRSPLDVYRGPGGEVYEGPDWE